MQAKAKHVVRAIFNSADNYDPDFRCSLSWDELVTRFATVRGESLCDLATYCRVAEDVRRAVRQLVADGVLEMSTRGYAGLSSRYQLREKVAS